MKTTIFKQLILNVITPVVIALLALGGLNYFNTQSLLVDSNTTENTIISDEILDILEFQDVALDVLESSLNVKMEKRSNVLVDQVFNDPDVNVEVLNLDSVREAIGMNAKHEDIYVINKEGIVVNTTFEEDMNLNFFSFGEEHKNHLLHVFEEKKFVSERFAIEGNTKRLKKYTYQPTNNGEYIIELGIYSEKADNIIGFVKNTLNGISKKQESIQSVELFIGADNPFSLNKDANLEDSHKELVIHVFKTKKDTSMYDSETGTRLDYDYFYMKRENTDLYSGAVVRITSDRGSQRSYLRMEAYKLLIIFGLTIAAVIFLIYRKVQIITSPIKRLVTHVNKIAGGKFDERANVEGSNEITKLSEHFNYMLEKIQDYYNDLEDKVKERTREVVLQKEEIESQRDTLAQKNEHLEIAYIKIEEQNKHIMDSIHYAKRIQNAILPHDAYVAKIIPDSFVLYRPKDIVSGDFYWMSDHEGLAMFAAVDCTGHGVPGAFMSIVGHDHLNHAVNVVGARSPGEILNSLNKGVTDSLNQQDQEQTVKDGMDLSLCTIDKKNKILSFSGANNPIYFIRNNEIEIIKGNKFPIGAYMEDELQEFTSHDIDYQDGDIIYLFSDGYADQFGGPKNKKFYYKRFRELLLSISSKPMAEQKEILFETFEEWRGNQEQVDDILVIGVRL